MGEVHRQDEPPGLEPAFCYGWAVVTLSYAVTGKELVYGIKPLPSSGTTVRCLIILDGRANTGTKTSFTQVVAQEVARAYKNEAEHHGIPRPPGKCVFIRQVPDKIFLQRKYRPSRRKMNMVGAAYLSRHNQGG